MKHNMAIIDRVIRVIIAVAIATLYFNGIITGTLGIVLIIVAFLFTASALINFCPMYTLMGIQRWEKKTE